MSVMGGRRCIIIDIADADADADAMEVVTATGYRSNGENGEQVKATEVATTV